MIDREKVLKGLECCAAMGGYECQKCPYRHECLDNDLPYGMSHLATDALALLEERDELLDRALQILNDNNSDMPCIAMHGSSFCEDFCNVDLLDLPKKECWLHYLEMKK